MDPTKLKQIAKSEALPTGGAQRRDLELFFAPWRNSVHRHLVFRAALDGLTVGAMAGATLAGAAWVTHHPALRVGGVAVAAIGATIGAVRGLRRRWNDERVALYVDGVLGTPESVTSAIVLGREAPAEVIESAVTALSSERPRAPIRVRRMHSLAFAGVVACIALLAVPAPRPAIASPPTGTDIVKLDQVPGLDKIAQVEKLPAKDAAQKERLQKIAEEARELKKKLLEGMPRREALDRLNKLKQKIEAEKKDIGQGEKKAGLDAAAQALKQNGFPGLADALEDRDLQSFDEMMERLANERETADREKAKEALEKAIEEAKKKGADDVAKALEKQKEKLDKRTDKADVLRELAEALKGSPGDPGKSGKSFDDKATDGAAKELADALRKGLEKLTPDERKKLADKLKQQAEKGGGNGKMSPKAKQKLKDLAKKLQTKEGQDELDKELKDLANGESGDSDEDKTNKGLDDAEDGADDAGKGLGDKDGDGDGKDGKGKGKGKGKDGKDGDGDGNGNGGGGGKDAKDGKDGNGGGGVIPSDGSGAGGPGPGGGAGDHDGKSKKVDAQTLKAKAKGVSGAKGIPKPGGSIEHAPGSDGATSTTKGTGDLNGSSADEINGVDKADIPEGVRRQVKSYFE